MKKITISVLLLFTALTWAQDGVSDTTFGTNGYVTVSRNNGATFGEFVQPDGKIIYIQGTQFKRLNANGEADTTFGVNGVINIVQPYYYIENFWVVNNQIVLLTKGIYDVYNMGRYNFDGTVESSLGGGAGYVTLDLGNDIYNQVRMKVSNDGKLLIGGNSDTAYGSYNDYYARRHNLDGTKDTTFNFDATELGINVAYTSIGYATDERIGDIDIMSNGQVIVSGMSAFHQSTSTQTSYTRATFAIIPNGSGQPAVRQHDYTCYNWAKSDLALDQNDNIYVLGGQIGNGTSMPVVNSIEKWNAAGNPSTSFGTNGLLTLSDLIIEGDKFADFTKILVQPDGKLLLGGTVKPTSGASFTPYIIMARYNQDGTLDSTFGTNGYVLFNIPYLSGNSGYNYFSHIIASADFSTVYMCGSNLDYAVVVKYNNSSLSVPTVSGNEFEVYPNPVTDWLHLKNLGETASVTVYNMLGQELLTEALPSEQGAINLSALKPATYVVKIAAGNNVKTLKVIKK
ncbi:T9SS type A sorting domain-containing protein [Flavobacterium sp. XGLA_31]|uniref:T9SS type A sorting domain-containing protein n=1 Tax=Flavobacterium sp. XGLA_31 TaxID=3447666 RepID=UPI003F3ECA48